MEEQGFEPGKEYCNKLVPLTSGLNYPMRKKLAEEEKPLLIHIIYNIQSETESRTSTKEAQKTKAKFSHKIDPTYGAVIERMHQNGESPNKIKGWMIL